MKNKIKLTGAELNCIEIAVQHHIDELEDAIEDRSFSILSVAFVYNISLILSLTSDGDESVAIKLTSSSIKLI